MKYTPEQNAIIQTVIDGKIPLIKVLAFAGCGKTFTLQAAANAVPGKKTYLAFNRSIADEGKEKFGRDVTVRTTHSLAYRYIVAGEEHYEGHIRGNYKPREIASLFRTDVGTAKRALAIFDAFCSSAAGGFNHTENGDASFAKKIWGAMMSGQIDITHDFYLKLFQLSLLGNKIKIPPVRLVMLDEAQDTTDVVLSIFYKLPAQQHIVVGDRHQQIYSFRGSVNAMSKMKAKYYYLSGSFRFNSTIAKKAARFLSIFKNEKKELKGFAKNQGDAKTKAVISRTNSALILKIDEYFSSKTPFITLRHPSSIFSLSLNLWNLVSGKETDPKFAYLNSFKTDFDKLPTSKKKKIFDNDLLVYIENTALNNDGDIELATATKIVKKHREKIGKLYSATLQNYKSPPPGAVVLTTAHTSKGLEWDKVTVLADFPCYKKVAEYIAESGMEDEWSDGYIDNFLARCDDPVYIDELNLYYVAITRGKIKVVDETDFSDLRNKDMAEVRIREELEQYAGRKHTRSKTRSHKRV